MRELSGIQYFMAYLHYSHEYILITKKKNYEGNELIRAQNMDLWAEKTYGKFKSKVYMLPKDFS